MGFWGIVLGAIAGLVFDLFIAIPLLGEAEPMGYLLVLILAPVIAGYYGHHFEEGRP